jgi:hypothetical protein
MQSERKSCQPSTKRIEDIQLRAVSSGGWTLWSVGALLFLFAAAAKGLHAGSHLETAQQLPQGNSVIKLRYDSCIAEVGWAVGFCYNERCLVTVAKGPNLPKGPNNEPFIR